MNAYKKAYYEAQDLCPPKRRASRRAAPHGSAFLRTVFLRSPSSGKRMRILDVTGAETLLDHLQIICGNKSERYLFKVYISEMPNVAHERTALAGTLGGLVRRSIFLK